MLPTYFAINAIRILFLIASELIDRVLEEDDVNNDGYLEYVEYVMGRQRDHIAQEKRSKLRIGT